MGKKSWRSRLTDDYFKKNGRLKNWLLEHPLLVLFIVVFGLLAVTITIFVIFDFTGGIVTNLGFDKKLWEWMDLLIVPVALAMIVYFFNKQQKENEQAKTIQRERENRERDERRSKENRRRDEHREKENNQRDNEKHNQHALQNYFDAISNLLLQKKGRKKKALFFEGSSERAMAQARTKAMWLSLSGKWREEFFRFLLESGLSHPNEDDADTVGVLQGSDLRHLNFKKAYLAHADLRGTTISNAKLVGTNLSQAQLSNAKLDGAILVGITLYGTEKTDASLKELDLSNAKIWHSKLKYVDLEGAIFNGAILKKTELVQSRLKNAQLINTIICDCDFNGSKLVGANLYSCQMQKVDLTGVDLSGAIINNLSVDEITRQSLYRKWRIALDIINNAQKEMYLAGEDLTGANLTGSYLEGADLTGAQLNDAILINVNLRYANLSNADLSGAIILSDEETTSPNLDLDWINWQNTTLNPEQLPEKERKIWELVNPEEDAEFLSDIEMLQGGMSMEASINQKRDLSGIDLSNAHLIGVDLHNTVLTGVNFENSTLSNANLDDTDLSDAILTNTNLNGASLINSKLENADLENATLERCNLSKANFNSANITQDQLAQAEHLEGARLPTGLKYEAL